VAVGSGLPRCTRMTLRLSWMNLGVTGNYAGSFLARDVENAHPQHEHDHPQNEDAIVEVCIFGRIPRDSELGLQKPE
jgi:hypothetical protein